MRILVHCLWKLLPCHQLLPQPLLMPNKNVSPLHSYKSNLINMTQFNVIDYKTL